MSKLNKSLLLGALSLAPMPALAAVDSGDTAWLLMASALVLLMTPGLAFFYAGMVRSKNVISTLFQNVVALGVIGLLWVIVGYSLAFSGGGEYIGDLGAVLLKGVGQAADEGSGIPAILFMAFQMMFAIITPILMTGAFAERVKFSSWILLMVVWSICVYSPVAHWVWSSNGWLFAKGALDFAGGFVVHMTAGFSALVLAILIGKRSDFGKSQKPHDLGMVLLGTSLLWFGWFGFNAGSALSSGGLAAHAFVTTFVSAAAAMVMWTLVDTIKDGKPSIMGACIGIVAGLVAVTPAAGFVTVGSAIIIGLLAGIICNLVARAVKSSFKIDDSLDVFACHGIGGLLGCIMTGLLATTEVNAGGANGMLNGGDTLLAANITGAVAVAIYSMVVTFVIVKVINAISPLRVSAQDEDRGLDGSQHGEAI